MKIRTTFFVFTLLLTTLTAQKRAPAATALTAFAETFSTRLTALASDTSITFEQVQPLFATLFEQHRRKTRRAVATETSQRYLVIVTLDGFRWQEVFGGADSLLLYDPLYTPDTATYRQRYWAATATQRRQQLLPFIWGAIAAEGQLYGNRNFGNRVNVANGLWFSYPGYNELFTGRPDDAHIFSNLKLPNPNENVLESLQRQKGFRNKVVAFSSWDAFPAILNEKRARIPVHTGPENRSFGTLRATRQHYQHLKTAFRPTWSEEEYPDAFTRAAAAAHLRNRHPRVAYIALGDTDQAAHAGYYDRYLDAAHETDRWLAGLWDFLQNDPTYRGRTTLLLTTDHGRGYREPRQWRDHNRHIAGADQIWLAAIGPDTPPLGEVQQPMQLYQQQLAQTIARLVGCTFEPGHPVAPAIVSMFRKMGDFRLAASKN